MHQPLLLTVEDIRRQFDAGTFSRGEDYARRDKVLDIGLDGDTMTGAVTGSGGKVYLQVIEISSGRRGIRIDGSCTCPVMENCKHVVAVLLASLGQAEAASESAPGAAVPPEAPGLPFA